MVLTISIIIMSKILVPTHANQHYLISHVKRLSLSLKFLRKRNYNAYNTCQKCT